MEKIAYGGYVIWVTKLECGEFFDVEKPGYDYAVYCAKSYEDAVRWIDENPDGDAVVARIEAEKAAHEMDIMMDILCG